MNQSRDLFIQRNCFRAVKLFQGHVAELTLLMILMLSHTFLKVVG